MTPQPIAFEDLRLGGEIARRAHRNFDRLERDPYRPASVFQGPDAKWPGDREGRAVLGLALLEAATHRPARHLDEILAAFSAHCNDRGYFGAVMPAGVCHEQQLSSHGWVLRGLCEVHLHRQTPDVSGLIETMLTNLVLPTAGRHGAYPIDPARREHGGSFSGTSQQEVDGWVLSSDIGCDYIFLDGVAQAAVLFPRPGLDAIVEEMIERFLQIDLRAIQAQTHATLTALRALLRWYEAGRGGPELLEAVRQRYALYRAHAMTENFANYNWFGRPRWTEPCAMVDSFQVALGLWRHGGEAGYLEDAHRIWHSGLNHGQRANGGYGCDSCLGTGETPFIQFETDESHWCCTMRGGEGLARAAQHAFCVAGDGVTLGLLLDAEATLRLAGGTLRLTASTEYPRRGRARLAVRQASVDGPVTLRLIAPSWGERFALSVNGQPVEAAVEEGFVTLRRALSAGDVVEYAFDQPVRSRPCLNAAHGEGVLFEAGPVLLGVDGDQEVHLDAGARIEPDGENRWRVEGADVVLTPLDDMIDRPDAAKGRYNRQVIFRS